MRSYPRRWIVYDTETREVPIPGRPGVRELEFRLGYAEYHEAKVGGVGHTSGFDFSTTEEFHGYIGEIPRGEDPLWVFAHNHSFDSRTGGWFRELARGSYTLVPPASVRNRGSFRSLLFLVDGPPFLMRLWRPDGQQLMLADTFNWIEKPLEWIGHALEKPKGKVSFRDATDEELRVYCRRDVEITEEALERVWCFCRSIGVVDWQPTLAAQALQHYKRFYGRRKVQMPKGVGVLSLDRHAYYGGRVDAFCLGPSECAVHQVDVNSLYPYLMQNSLFPKEVIDYEHGAETRSDGAPPHPAQTTAEVWLDTADVAYPVRSRDGTWYCRGKVRTILCGPELRRAVESGHVVASGRWTRYRMSALFAQFITDMWAVRLEHRRAGDRLGDWLAKMLMDALYGKFGQRSGEWITCGQDYPPDHFGHGLVVGRNPAEDREYRVIAGQYERRLRDELAPHAFVPIAAFTTSYGRVFMDAVRGKLHDAGVYYQATDSLLIDSENLMMLNHAGLLGEDEIGKFRVEETFEWIEIKGPNWIERPKRPIRGSVPRSAERIGPRTFEGDKWSTFWGGICRDNSISPLLKRTSISLSEKYGRMNGRGWPRLKPWVISNWQMTPEEQARQPILPNRDQGG